MSFNRLCLLILILIAGSCGKPKKQPFIRGVNSLNVSGTDYALLYHTTSYSSLAVVKSGSSNSVTIPERSANHQFTMIDGRINLYGRTGKNRYYVLAPDQTVERNAVLPINDVQGIKQIDGDVYFWDSKKCQVNKGSLTNYVTVKLDSLLCTSHSDVTSRVANVYSYQGSIVILADTGIISLNLDQFLYKFPTSFVNPFGGMVNVGSKELLVAFSGDYSTGLKHGLGYFSEVGELLDDLSFPSPPTQLLKISDTEFIVSTGFSLYQVNLKSGKLSKSLLVKKGHYAIDAMDFKNGSLIWAELKRKDRAFGYEIKKMAMIDYDVEIVAQLNENVTVDKILILP